MHLCLRIGQAMMAHECVSKRVHVQEIVTTMPDELMHGQSEAHDYVD